MGIFILLSNISAFGQENNKTLKDIDGNIYKTVTIGTQEWMAENLKTTRYRNGNLIGTTIPATLFINDESEPKYQWSYEGDESNVAIYGRLYTWYAATDSRNICPNGWHLPTSSEQRTLTNYLFGKEVASGLLREAGTDHWQSPNSGATNCSGFTALPGGKRINYNRFVNLGSDGYWWSSNGSNESAWQMTLTQNRIYIEPINNKEGLSIRCLRDN